MGCLGSRSLGARGQGHSRTPVVFPQGGQSPGAAPGGSGGSGEGLGRVLNPDFSSEQSLAQMLRRWGGIALGLRAGQLSISPCGHGGSYYWGQGVDDGTAGEMLVLDRREGSEQNVEKARCGSVGGQ